MCEDLIIFLLNLTLFVRNKVNSLLEVLREGVDFI